MSMKKGLNTFVLVFCLAFHALAGNTFIWKGGGYTTAWSDGSNWDGWVAPTAGDSVVVPAGKTATARDGDLSLLNSLAGIEIRTGGGLVLTEMTSDFSFVPPLAGGGSFTARDFGFTITIGSDNSAFEGTFDFANVYAQLTCATGFGTTNRVSVAAYTPRTDNKWGLRISGLTVSNRFDFADGGNYALYASGGATFCGPVTLDGYRILTGNAHFKGGFAHTGIWTSYIGGSGATGSKIYLECEEPIGGEYTQYADEGGPFYAKLNGTVYLGALFSSEYGYYFMVDGTLVCTKQQVFSPVNGVRLGGDSNNKPINAVFDIGGYDQAISNLSIRTDIDLSGAALRSENPATLTILGGVKAVGGADVAFPGQVEGFLSLELNSTSSASITLAGTNSLTKGGLYARRGTITVDGAARFPNLTKLKTSETGSIVLNAPVGADADLNVEVSTGAKITIANDVVLAAHTLRTNGVYVAATAFDANDPAWSEFFDGTGTVRVLTTGRVPSPPNADTLAFYTFDDIEPGVSYVNMPIANRAGVDFTGGIVEGVATCEVDAPGRFIYESGRLDASCLAFEPRSIHLGGATETCLFPALATAISSNDDYTVEFFWKLDEDDAGVNTWTPMLKFDIGTSHQPDTHSSATEGPMSLLLQKDYRWYLYTCSCTSQRAYFDYGSSSAPESADGLWHHIAIVYSSDDRKYSLIGDYELKSSAVSSTTNKVQSASFPLELGGGAFKGHISCLRVTKKALGIGELLHASNGLSPFPGTVFHWTMDGDEGSVPTTVTNANSVDSNIWFPGQYYYAMACPNACGGHGRVEAFTEGGITLPHFSADIPRRLYPNVMSGTNMLWRDQGSISLGCKTRTTEAGVVGGSSIAASNKEFLPVRSGSFTMEGFFRFRAEAWKQRIVDAGASNNKVAIMGLSHSSKDSNFSLNGEYSSGKFRMTLIGRGNASNWDGFTASYVPNDISFLQDQRWHHIAIVYDDATTNMGVYFDKEKLIDLTLQKPFVPNGSFSSLSYKVGEGFGCCAFMGDVDEVRLVRRALLTDEFLNFDGPHLETGFFIIVR